MPVCSTFKEAAEAARRLALDTGKTVPVRREAWGFVVGGAGIPRVEEMTEDEIVADMEAAADGAPTARDLDEEHSLAHAEKEDSLRREEISEGLRVEEENYSRSEEDGWFYDD